MPNTHKQVTHNSKIRIKQTQDQDKHRHHVHEISGWLEKQRKVRGWVWKKYWFVLDGDQLGYYKQPDDQTSSRGLIDINQARFIREVATGNRAYTFEIVTHTRTHTLSADSAECRDRWMKILQSAMHLRYHQSSIMERPSCDSISDVDEDYQNLSEEDLVHQDSIPANRMSSHSDSVFPHDVSAENLTKTTSENNPLKSSSPRFHFTVSPPTNGSTAAAGVTFRDREVGEISGVNHQVTRDGHSVVLRRSGATRSNSRESLQSNAILNRSEKDNALQELDDKRIQELCDSIKDINFDFPPIPALPYPRLEMTWDSVFDQIRTFIAQNRAPKEVYATPRKSQVGGKAMKELKCFLAQLDEEYF